MVCMSMLGIKLDKNWIKCCVTLEADGSKTYGDRLTNISCDCIKNYGRNFKPQQGDWG